MEYPKESPNLQQKVDEMFKKIEIERQKYLTLRDAIMEKYMGKWICMNNGEIIDFDDDANKLELRALEKLEGTGRWGLITRVGYEKEGGGVTLPLSVILAGE